MKLLGQIHFRVQNCLVLESIMMLNSYLLYDAVNDVCMYVLYIYSVWSESEAAPCNDMY